MNNDILFSIIIPTFNRAAFIGKSIESVLAQSYPRFELIIIDDGSTDHTEEVVRQYNDPRVLYHKKANAERGAARNTGALLAQGLYVNFFDSDDILLPNHLEEAVKVICRYDNPEIFFLGYEIRTPTGKLVTQINNLKGNVGPKLMHGNLLGCNGVIVRKDIALRFPFSEDRRIAVFEDWQLWLRIASRFPIRYNNTITSTLINHTGRSVLSTTKEVLTTRGRALMISLKDDPIFMEVFGHKLNILQGNVYTYISLHLALTKKYRGVALKYLMKGIILNPREILKRRFLAILKHLP